MKPEAVNKFELLIKDMVENTDFEDDLELRLRKVGYDKAPKIELLKERNAVYRQHFGRAKSLRWLKAAGFSFAVFAVAAITTITANSDFMSAGKLYMYDAIININNGFLSQDIQLQASSSGGDFLNELSRHFGNLLNDGE